MGALLVFGCAPEADTHKPPDTAVWVLDLVGLPSAFEDLAISSGFSDRDMPTLQRGRACLSADFDLDGLTDVFVGNPADLSYVMLNRSTPGSVSFGPKEVVFDGDLAWGGSAFDYDNDGDVDLFVSMGGSEASQTDVLLENTLIDNGVFTGALGWQDVTLLSGVGAHAELGTVLSGYSANSVVGDVDRDGFDDLFVNNALDPSLELGDGRNTLWMNNGDGTFSDRTVELGLGDDLASTRHSTLLDVDNDGDLDLYVNNYEHSNSLYKNLLVETGVAHFESASAEWSITDDVTAVYGSFVSATGDLNNDGWWDIVVFHHGVEVDGSPYPLGHAVLMNTGALGQPGFVNVAEVTGINMAYVPGPGVMGSQLGDLNLDGLLDVFVGNGSPTQGEVDGLYVTTGTKPVAVPSLGGSIDVPVFEDWTRFIDYPAEWGPDDDGFEPPYPYRTHGTCIVDFDLDGQPELAILNGGKADQDAADAQEPDRLFRPVWEGTAPQSVTVRLHGDGAAVSSSGIGARVVVTFGAADGTEWAVHRALLGGNTFSAQNGSDLVFGAGTAAEVVGVEVTWLDGAMVTVPAADLPSFGGLVELWR